MKRTQAAREEAVRVAVTGSADINTDYTQSGMNFFGGNQYTVLILGNQLSRTVTITPILDALEEEEDESVIVTVLDTGETYAVGVPDSATIIIRNFVDAFFKDGFEDL